MKQETIEQEAIKYAKEQGDFGVGLFHAVKYFVYGAHWRISSVWHNIDNKLPECGKHVVNEDWFDFIAKDEKDLKRIIKKYPFKLWAYISDLLSGRKEEAK